MNKIFLNLLLLTIGVTLTACTSFLNTEPTTVKSQTTHERTVVKTTKTQEISAAGTPAGPPISGNIGTAMDGTDKTKMSHALDKGLGKQTHWVNAVTGTSYTVVPTQKVTVSGYQFCRKYNTTTMQGNKTKQVSGTACVSADGNWQAI